MDQDHTLMDQDPLKKGHVVILVIHEPNLHKFS